MSPEEEARCAEARKRLRIEAAFRAGDLDALRAAVDDPSVIPNGPISDTIGPCLVLAIYTSPLPFIRTLLDLGADPNAPVDDGFPALIAALAAGQPAPGASARTDVDDLVRLLLKHGADPNQRGINDYTALHMAVAAGQPLCALYLLDAGADREMRTRIDDCDTPLDMARAAGLEAIASILEGQTPRRLRSGLTQIVDIAGAGEPVRRQHRYRIRLRMWLNRGEPVRWHGPSGPVGIARLEDGGETLFTEWRIDRRQLVNGLFYGIDGMRVGGTRRIEIAPHLAYGERGVPGVIPPGAVVRTEITILAVA